MGRATVISGGTDGRYVIEMDYGLAQRDARVAKLDALLSELDDRKTWQQGQVDGFQGGLDSFAPEMDALIVEYVALSNAAPQDAAAIAAKRKQIDAKTAGIIKQQLWLGQAKNALAQTDLEIKQLTLDRAALMALEITEQRPAWCADLTEDAAGEVATIEVPGESALILIAPQAPAPVAADGVLTAREIQSPAQVYWNAAVLPGWQKFLPTHRWGTITALDTYADTATVALAAAVSSAQGLDVNQAETLTGIPVEYMECHASVFNVGDNVIVGFTGQDWAQPKVIGFLDHPRACGGPSLYCIPADGTNIYGWSPPTTTPEGAPINDGKGSAAYYGIPGDPNPVVVDGTNRTAGVTSPFVRAGVGLQPRVTRGVRADVAGLPAHGPTNVGNSPDADNYSSMSRAMLEWVSSGHGTVVTYFDRVRVNGADKGVPAVDGVAGAPVKAFIPQKVGDNPDFIFAVALVSGGASLQFFTRPLAGDSSVAWTLLDTLVMGDIVSTPSVDINNLNRVLVHPEATELAIWFSEGVAGVGHLVVNPYTAGYTFTQAPSTYGRTPSVNYVPASGTYVYSFEFKFSIDYVDGSLAYATVTGVRTHVLTQIDGPPYPPGHYHEGQATFASTEATITEVITADFWGVELELSNYSFHSYGITNYVTVGDIGLVEPSDYTQTASLTSKQVYYYGGAGDPILYTTKDYPSTVTRTKSYADSWLAGRCEDPACFDAAGLSASQTIPAMTVSNCVIHNGTTVEMSTENTPEYVATWGAQPSDYDLPALALGSESNWNATWLEGEWGRTYWYPSSPAITAQAILNVFRTIISLGTAETFANTGSSYHTTAYFLEGSVNLRHLGGFAIFSNPALTYPSEVFLTEPSVETSGSIIRFKHPPTLATNADHDYSLWHTWCSDPAALSRYALTLAAAPPATGRLKHLQINSAA